MAAMYKQLLDSLAEVLESELVRVGKSHSNYEVGDEFEIALCKAFRLLLPERYGVCRGCIGFEEIVGPGETKEYKEGDDVIIYDKQVFPTLRLLGNDPAKLETVPVEAVLAYFECKHTIYLSEDESEMIGTACVSMTYRLGLLRSLGMMKLQ